MRLNFSKLQRTTGQKSTVATHTHTHTRIHAHTLVPVTRESWRIGIFSTHQRGTLKNGTRILFTVSREEQGKLFDTERNGSGGVEVETVSSNKRGGKTSGRNIVPGIEPTRWNSRTDIFNHRGRFSIFDEFRFFRFVPISLR